MATLRHQLEIIAHRQRSLIQACHDKLDHLSDSQLRWAPDGKTWSIALVLDHLIKVHVATSPAFMRVLLAAPPAGNEKDQELPYSFSDRLIVQLLSPGARFKLPVPRIFIPVEHHGSPHHLVEKLYEEFDAFEIVLNFADEKQLRGLRVSSPAGNARPSVIAYLDATVQHNKYHWQQIEALMKDPNFPKA